MDSRKVYDQEWTLEELQHHLDTLVDTFHPNHSKPFITEKRRNKAKYMT